MFRRRRRRDEINQVVQDSVAILTTLHNRDVDTATNLTFDMDKDRLVGVAMMFGTWLLMEWESRNPELIGEHLQGIALRNAERFGL